MERLRSLTFAAVLLPLACATRGERVRDVGVADAGSRDRSESRTPRRCNGDADCALAALEACAEAKLSACDPEMMRCRKLTDGRRCHAALVQAMFPNRAAPYSEVDALVENFRECEKDSDCAWVDSFRDSRKDGHCRVLVNRNRISQFYEAVEARLGHEAKDHDLAVDCLVYPAPKCEGNVCAVHREKEGGGGE